MKLRHGFFGFLGNNLEFTNIDRYFWLGFAFLLLLIIMIFKTKIYTWFNKKDRSKGLQIIGIIAIALNVLNRVLTIVGGYPRYWELVPLQLCRFTFTTMGIMLAFKKAQYLKFLAIPAIIGSITALIVSKLYSSMQSDWMNDGYPPYSQGADNYFYWDNYIIHIFILVSACFFWTVYKWKFTIKDLLSSAVQLNIYTVFVFILNIMITAIWPKEHADYLYVGIISSYHLPLGPLGDWPFTLISFSLIGYIAFISLWFLWIFLGKFDLGQKIFWRKSIHDYKDTGKFDIRLWHNQSK